ncbi:MAG: hypothetical protein JSS66_05605 [Armatimonadetes bacterium]|nr:hypothetical protein [Armatimonadota bacterium]
MPKNPPTFWYLGFSLPNHTSDIQSQQRRRSRHRTDRRIEAQCALQTQCDSRMWPSWFELRLHDSPTDLGLSDWQLCFQDKTAKEVVDSMEHTVCADLAAMCADLSLSFDSWKSQVRLVRPSTQFLAGFRMLAHRSMSLPLLEKLVLSGCSMAWNDVEKDLLLFFPNEGPLGKLTFSVGHDHAYLPTIFCTREYYKPSVVYAVDVRTLSDFTLDAALDRVVHSDA